MASVTDKEIINNLVIKADGFKLSKDTVFVCSDQELPAKDLIETVQSEQLAKMFTESTGVDRVELPDTQAKIFINLIR